MSAKPFHRPEGPKDPFQQSNGQYNESSYTNPSKHKKIPRKKKRPLLLIAIIILIIAVLAAAYILIKEHDKPKTLHKSSTTSQKVTTEPAVSSSTRTYTSNEQSLSLSFDYPSSWQVSPSNTTTTDTSPITATSPITSITNASGVAGPAKIVVMIRESSSDVSELASNNATSAQNSVQFAYSQPTPDQLQYPYLTFLHFTNGANVAGAFEETVVTGQSTFTPGVSINDDSLSGIEPIITAAFYSCGTQACPITSEPSLAINNDEWTNTQFFQQVMTLIESMKLN